ncbi:MAG: hypothetical protein RLZZ292_2764 [Bacteroidota bacterium]|jgi:hypothetical protein
MKKNILFFVLLPFILSSCLVLLYGRYGRGPLTMARESLTSNNFMTDGFYHYHEAGDGFLNIAFFRNGIFLVPYATPYSKTKNKAAAEAYFKTITKEKNPYHDVVFAWGVFKIQNNDLTMEGWMSGDGGNKYHTKIFNGKILNDSTFVIPKGFINPLPDTFHFVKTSVKPDSTCPFIPY